MVTRWVRVSVAAGICGVHTSTVRRWCADGLIPPAHYQRTAGGHYRVDAAHAHSLRDAVRIPDEGAQVQCPHCGSWVWRRQTHDGPGSG